MALTRAKEKLIITGIVKEFDKELEKMLQEVNRYKKCGDKINPVLVKKYKKYLDWILLVYQYEKENTDNINLNIYNKQQIIDDFKKIEKEEIDIVKLLEEKETDNKELEKFIDILNYSYPYKLATLIPTKTSVTNLKQMELEINKETLNNEEQQIEFAKPKFLKSDEEQKITGAQKGTLVHLCMQKLNEKVDYDLNKIKQLINELTEKQIITAKEAEAINPFKILQFTKSNIWKEVQQAKEVYKEKPFYINIPAREIYNEEIEEEVLVQGIIDLYYINKDNQLILVDYKTDFVEKGNEKELIEKYKKQLDIYEKALEDSLNKKVYKKYIYSVYLDKEIEA